MAKKNGTGIPLHPKHVPESQHPRDRLPSSAVLPTPNEFVNTPCVNPFNLLSQTDRQFARPRQPSAVLANIIADAGIQVNAQNRKPQIIDLWFHGFIDMLVVKLVDLEGFEPSSRRVCERTPTCFPWILSAARTAYRLFLRPSCFFCILRHRRSQCLASQACSAFPERQCSL